MSTAESDKAFKQAEHSRERAAVRVALRIGADVPSPRLFGDPYGGGLFLVNAESRMQADRHDPLIEVAFV